MSRLSRAAPVLALLVRAARIWASAALPLALVNLAWSALSATVILAPIATAGLFYAANRAAYGERVTVRALWDGVRRWSLPALLWGILSALIWFGTFGTVRWRWVDRTGWPAILLVLLGLLWTVVQFYFWPVLFEQRDKRLIPALRTSVLMILAMPGYSLTLFAAAALLMLLSVSLRLPLLIFTPGYVALAANLAVLDRLALLGYPPDPAHAKRGR